MEALEVQTTGRVSIEICRADFSDPRLVDFLQAHLDDLAPTAPAESRHALDISALQRPDVRLWMAREGGAIVGSAALAALEAGHDELKSMRTEPRRRGSGIASTMLRHVLSDASGGGTRRVSLETGSMAFFAPARALYAKYGFVECGPFGTYVSDPNSVFMTRAL